VSALSPAPARARLLLVPPDDARRAEVEAFIRAVYAERFGAQLKQFAPTLVALEDEQGLCAAAGCAMRATLRCFLSATSTRPSSNCCVCRRATASPRSATSPPAAPERGGA
jgi:hypothetical protein